MKLKRFNEDIDDIDMEDFDEEENSFHLRSIKKNNISCGLE